MPPPFLRSFPDRETLFGVDRRRDWPFPVSALCRVFFPECRRTRQGYRQSEGKFSSPLISNVSYPCEAPRTGFRETSIQRLLVLLPAVRGPRPGLPRRRQQWQEWRFVARRQQRGVVVVLGQRGLRVLLGLQRDEPQSQQSAWPRPRLSGAVPPSIYLHPAFYE